MNDLMEILRENIQNRREELGFTQKELSLEIGKNETYIHRIESENNRDTPSIHSIGKISDALDIEPSKLFIENEFN